MIVIYCSLSIFQILFPVSLLMPSEVPWLMNIVVVSLFSVASSRLLACFFLCVQPSTRTIFN